MIYESDENLVRDFVDRGVGNAMETLFRRHLQRVYTLASRYLSVREDAEEATSETFLRAFRALRSRQFRGEASMATWLAKIAVNVCIERLRQPRLPTLAFDDLDELAVPELSPRHDIVSAVALLPDSQRLVLTLCDLEGYSALETSAILGRSLTATKSLHYRARRSLREILEQAEGDQAERERS